MRRARDGRAAALRLNEQRRAGRERLRQAGQGLRRAGFLLVNLKNRAAFCPIPMAKYVTPGVLDSKLDPRPSLPIERASIHRTHQGNQPVRRGPALDTPHHAEIAFRIDARRQHVWGSEVAIQVLANSTPLLT
jgi:hypothetical protein